MEAPVREGRMKADVHVPVELHVVVVANERPLDHVIALAMAVQPRLLVHAALLHPGVVLGEDFLRRGAGLQHAHGVVLRLADDAEGVDQLLRRLAEHVIAPDMGHHAAGPGVLALIVDDVAVLHLAALLAAAADLRRLPGRGG